MRSLRIVVTLLIALIIFPQTITLVQMGMSALHGGHQDGVPIAECQRTLPCLWAHQPAIPPAAKTIEQLLSALMLFGLAVFGSMVIFRPQQFAAERHRIRLFLYHRVGVHMHAFDQLRQWIARGMMGQKITPVLVS